MTDPTQSPSTEPAAPPITPTTSASPSAPTSAPSLPPAAPVVAGPAARKRGPLDWLLIGAAVLAVGGVAFAIGRTTAPAAASTTFPGGVVIDGNAVPPNGSFDPGTAGGPGGPGGPAFIGAGGPTIDGTVTAIDATSITLELPSGDTMTITLDDDTTYHEATDTDPSAIAVGDDVSVQVDGGVFRRGGNGASNDGGNDGGGGAGLTANDVTVDR